MRGISTPVAILTVLVLLLGIGLIGAFYAQMVKPAAIPVTYDGEFDAVGLSADDLEDPFYSSFTINPVEWSDDTQASAGNATVTVENGTAVSLGTEYQLDLYIKIDGPVRDLNLEYEADDQGVFNTSSIKIKEVSFWDYKEGTKIRTIPVEDQEFDWHSGVLEAGKYVLRIRYEVVKGITTSETEGTEDVLGYISGDLDTTGDRDEFSDFKVRVLTA